MTVSHVRLSLLLGLSGLLFLAGCARQGAGLEHPPEGRPIDRDTVPLATFRKDLNLQPLPAPATLQAWVPAEAAGDEAAQVLLTAPVSGIIAKISATPGRPAVPGAPLLQLRSPELAELKSRWLGAQARLRRAQVDLAREQRLTAAQAGARRDLEAAEVEQATATAEAESARIALQARGLTPEESDGIFTLRAPMAGSIGSWKVKPGQGVASNEALGSFQTAAANLAVLELPPPAPARWRLGSKTRARDGGHTWMAEVIGIPTALGDQSGRMTYRLRLTGGPLPLPGTPLEIEVPLSDGVLLPAAALQQVEGVWGVFLEDGEMARFTPVKRGPDAGRNVLVLGGLPTKGQVFTEGAYLLKSRLLRLRSGGSHE